MNGQDVVPETGECLESRSGQPLSTHQDVMTKTGDLERIKGLNRRVGVQISSRSDIVDLELLTSKSSSLNAQTSHLAGVLVEDPPGPCQCVPNGVLEEGVGQDEEERVQAERRRGQLGSRDSSQARQHQAWDWCFRLMMAVRAVSNIGYSHGMC